MAFYTMAQAAAWGAVEGAENGDGTSTYWANHAVPMFQRVRALAAYLRTNGVMPIGGVALNEQGTDPDDPDGLTLIGCSGRTGAPGTLGGPDDFRAHYDYIVDSLIGKEEAYLARTTAPDANATYTVTLTTNRVILIPATLAAGRTYTLNNPADDGLMVTLSRLDPEFTQLATIKNAAAATLIVLGPGEYEWVDLISNGGNWVVLRRSEDIAGP